MGLVIEEMRDQDPGRPRDVLLRRAREPGQLALEPVRVERLRPAKDHLVEGLALALEILPIRIIPDRFLDAARRFWRAGEPVHPGAVAPQQVIEGRMDRPEEGAALAFAILLGEPIGAAVEIPVLPAIIVRHPLHELPVDHGKPPCLGLVSRAQRRTKSCAAEPGPIVQVPHWTPDLRRTAKSGAPRPGNADPSHALRAALSCAFTFWI